MPLYDYRCPHCEHSFEEFRPLAIRATALPISGLARLQSRSRGLRV